MPPTPEASVSSVAHPARFHPRLSITQGNLVHRGIAAVETAAAGRSVILDDVTARAVVGHGRVGLGGGAVRSGPTRGGAGVGLLRPGRRAEQAGNEW